MTWKEELPQSDIKNELITKKDKMKREFNINKDEELVIESYKNQQSFNLISHQRVILNSINLILYQNVLKIKLLKIEIL